MEQMQILLAILVLLPFVSALLLVLCGSDRMRRLTIPCWRWRPALRC